MNIDELIGRYLLAAAEHWEAKKYLGENRAVLRRCNGAADELRRLAKEIGRCDSADVRQFSRLLGDSRNGVNGWAAIHLIEVIQAPPDVVERAFETIEEISKGDDMDAVILRMRLPELRRQYRPIDS